VLNSVKILLRGYIRACRFAVVASPCRTEARLIMGFSVQKGRGLHTGRAKEFGTTALVPKKSCLRSSSVRSCAG